MKRLCISLLGVTGLILSANAGTAVAAPSSDSAGTMASSSTATICHATRSHTHPYVKITVSTVSTGSRSYLDAHKAHRDRTDITPVPEAGCPADLEFPQEQAPEPGTYEPCVVSLGVTQTRTTVTGTDGNDTIDCTGASPRKWVLGLGGNDTVTGTAFPDTIIGGTEDDTLTGGIGIDYLEGNNGNDTATGSGGPDTLVAGSGNDTLSGGVGRDTLIASRSDAGPSTGADTLNGDTNADTCSAVEADGDTLVSCEM